MVSENIIEKIDLEEGKIKVGEEWLTEDEIRYAIKMKVESDDYNVADLAVALKTLIEEMNKSTIMRIRVPKEMIEEFEKISNEKGETVESMLRTLLVEYIKNKGETEEELTEEQGIFDEIYMEPREENTDDEGFLSEEGEEINIKDEDEVQETNDGLVDIKGMLNETELQELEIAEDLGDEVEEVETVDVELGVEETEEIASEDIDIEEEIIQKEIEPEEFEVGIEDIEVEDEISEDIEAEEELEKNIPKLEEIDIDLDEPDIEEVESEEEELDELLKEEETPSIDTTDMELGEDKISEPATEGVKIGEVQEEEVEEEEETSDEKEELTEGELEGEEPPEKRVEKRKTIFKKKKIRLRRV